jgi:coenzyme F420-reducing hydrogenase delta subunit
MTNNVNLAEKPADCQRLRAPRLTVFYCVNAGRPLDLGLDSSGGSTEQIKLPCSAMVRDVFLLRAFEAGAEGVLVVACAPDRCKRGTGSSYAEKRVVRTRKLLDEIGLGGWRLAFARLMKPRKPCGSWWLI